MTALSEQALFHPSTSKHTNCRTLFLAGPGRSCAHPTLFPRQQPAPRRCKLCVRSSPQCVQALFVLSFFRSFNFA